MVPHSRVVIPDIFRALESFLTEEITQQQATLLMNCNSRHSFNLYYRRFSSHVHKWISFLAAFLQQQELETGIIRSWSQTRLLANESYRRNLFRETISDATFDVKRKWSQFTDLISSLKIDRTIETSPWIGMIFKFEYAHSLLGGSKMGLGP